MESALQVSPRLSVPLAEFEWSFVRSSGPGGQNVNKVNSKAMLTWPVKWSPSLTAELKHRFVGKYANKINRSGQLVLSSQRFRDQSRNVADCLAKLRQMLAEIEHPPRRRIPSRPTASSGRRRLAAKRRQATRKQLRRGPAGDE
jgi:ribosome-associated protein